MKKPKRKTTVTKKLKRKFQKLYKKTTTIINLKCSKMINPICKKMKGEWQINTTKPEIYTEEIRKNWVCLLCKYTKEV